MKFLLILLLPILLFSPSDKYRIEQLEAQAQKQEKYIEELDQRIKDLNNKIDNGNAALKHYVDVIETQDVFPLQSKVQYLQDDIRELKLR